MIGHAGLLHLLPYRIRRYKESKLWCQVCMPLQDDSSHPTIEARPMLWMRLATNLQSERHIRLCRAPPTYDVADVSIVWDNVFTIGESHALWNRCTCWSGVKNTDDRRKALSSVIMTDESELHIASIETRSWYGTWLYDDSKIECCRLWVDAAEVKNAYVASVFAHLIPSPPSFTDRVAWIHWVSSKSTLRMVERPDLRMESNCSRSGWL